MTINQMGKYTEVKTIRKPYSDPRPDLIEDWFRWELLLWVAYRQDKPGLLFGLLHGLRCGGARINDRWKLAYKPGMSELPIEQIRYWEQILFTHKDDLLIWLNEAAKLEKAMDKKDRYNQILC